MRPLLPILPSKLAAPHKINSKWDVLNRIWRETPLTESLESIIVKARDFVEKIGFLSKERIRIEAEESWVRKRKQAPRRVSTNALYWASQRAGRQIDERKKSERRKSRQNSRLEGGRKSGENSGSEYSWKAQRYRISFAGGSQIFSLIKRRENLCEPIYAF